jgi:hypothetical protein
MIRTPLHCPYVVVGTGLEGMSARWFLAMELRERGAGTCEDIPGVGSLVPKVVLGEPQQMLERLGFPRCQTGRLHPVSHWPFS